MNSKSKMAQYPRYRMEFSGSAIASRGYKMVDGRQEADQDGPQLAGSQGLSLVGERGR